MSPEPPVEPLAEALRPRNLVRSPFLPGAVLRAIPPLVGVFVFGWSAAEWVLFWFFDTVIVGVVNIPRILAARAAPGEGESEGGPIGTAVFFVAHYGFFVALQFLFLAGLTGGIEVFEFVGRRDVLGALATALFIESADFAHRTLRLAERDHYSPTGQMFRPYPRIFVQQFTVILGAWIGLLAGLLGPESTARGVFLLLLGVRFVVDLASPFFDRALRSSRPYRPLDS